MNVRLPEQNQVLLTGNLTKDPEVRYTAAGTAMCRFRVAVNRRYKDPKSGEWKDDTSYINVVVWREAAEQCGKRLHKGSPVHIEGRLKSYEYEDKNAPGQKRSGVEVEARRVQILEKSETGGASAGTSSRGASQGSDEAPSDSADIEEVPF